VDVTAIEATHGGHAVALEYTAAKSGARLDRDALAITIDGTAVDASWTDDARLVVPALPRGRHTLALAAVDDDGIAAPPVHAIVWSEPIAPTFADAIVYQVVVDRFRGDEGSVLAPPDSPGARAGGTLSGVLAELEAGRFDELAISTLWLSPVYVNPDEALPARDDPDNLVTGYHGYWPVDSRGVDERIGGAAALHALVEAAHARGIGVLLDVVPNHYYEENPRAVANPDWFNRRDPLCICGAPDCPWSTEIETCWFAPYLPDVRLQHPEALAAAIDDARFWQREFRIDGFRFDAVPMMPRAATRRLLHAVREDAQPAGATVHVGEVFTGGGAEGIEAIRYHLGPAGLDSAFDFPLMWAIREAVAGGDSGFDAVEAVLDGNDTAIEGSGAVLARMLGNHDTPRVMSAIAGDADVDPWTAPPPQPDDAELYMRLRLAFALVLALPGAPVIYYGDELGLAGANDPDSRRVMPDDGELAAVQLELAADVGRLARLRRCLPALRRGARVSVGATASHFAFVRDAGDGSPALVVLSRSTVPTALSVPAAVPPGWYKDAMSGERVEIASDGASIELAAFGVRILVPEMSSCGEA
jgi:glycosidase